MVFAPNVTMVANPLPVVVLRCTTKLVSLLELSVQVRLILLDDVAVAPKPVGAIGALFPSEMESPCGSTTSPHADKANAKINTMKRVLNLVLIIIVYPINYASAEKIAGNIIVRRQT